jgi:hypothetical protein
MATGITAHRASSLALAASITTTTGAIGEPDRNEKGRPKAALLL